MDQSKKSDYEITELRTQQRFDSVDKIKEAISNSVNSQVGDIGYISPGHGMKGKKHTLLDDDDVDEMYDLYSGKRARTILLWCYLATASVGSKTKKKRKHSQNEDDSSCQYKRAVSEKKILEIEDIVSKLKEKHGKAFRIEHLNAWAHLIQIGKHSSYNTPPNYPYFVGRKSSQPTSSKNITEDSPGNSETCPTQGHLSPGKRVHLRSECIDQLSRWHSLKESGGISAEEYEELRKNIIGDIGKF